MEFDLGCACRGNNLDKMLQPTVLAILFKRNMYGSYIIEELAKSPMFGDERPDKAGVYRYLKRMEKEEMITASIERNGQTRPRRIYSITDHGKRCLLYWMESLYSYSYQLTKLTKELREAVK